MGLVSESVYGSSRPMMIVFGPRVTTCRCGIVPSIRNSPVATESCFGVSVASVGRKLSFASMASVAASFVVGACYLVGGGLVVGGLVAGFSASGTFCWGRSWTGVASSKSGFFV